LAILIKEHQNSISNYFLNRFYSICLQLTNQSWLEHAQWQQENDFVQYFLDEDLQKDTVKLLGV
jgi:hypothetical protein